MHAQGTYVNTHYANTRVTNPFLQLSFKGINVCSMVMRCLSNSHTRARTLHTRVYLYRIRGHTGPDWRVASRTTLPCGQFFRQYGQSETFRIFSQTCREKLILRKVKGTLTKTLESGYLSCVHVHMLQKKEKIVRRTKVFSNNNVNYRSNSNNWKTDFNRIYHVDNYLAKDNFVQTLINCE